MAVAGFRLVVGPAPVLKKHAILASVTLLLLVSFPRAADLAPDNTLRGINQIVSEGKLAHALRAADLTLESYPRDPRLQALRAQLAEAVKRELPADRPLARSAGGGRPASRAPVVTNEAAEPGRDFVTGTAQVTMIWIRPGTFFMSNPLGSDDDTWVTLTRGYWLGRTEVTQEQWQAVIEENPFPSHFKGSDRPVEWVSWVSAMEFCRRLTERERAAGRLPENYEYTLPTEAQWEYACRAGTTGKFAGELAAMAWYAANSGRQTHPVAHQQPNAWGLYDMHGNVAEWCRDSYVGGYPGGHVIDPWRDEIVSDDGSPRVLRGGGWLNVEGTLHSAYRGRAGLNYTGAGAGFRLALAPIVTRHGAESRDARP